MFKELERINKRPEPFEESDHIRTVYNWGQCFAPEDLEKKFAECGLAVEAFYSDVAGAPYDRHSSEFAVVAKRS